MVTFVTTHLSKYVLRSDDSEAAIIDPPDEPTIMAPAEVEPAVPLPAPIEAVETPLSPLELFVRDNSTLLLIIAIAGVILFVTMLTIHLVYRRRTRYIVG